MFLARRGHFSHGLNRLEMYCNDLLHGICQPNNHPKVLKESGATALVDGCNGLGPVVGNFCMDLAVQKAKSVGVGWVIARGSNHYGIAGWYSQRAMKDGMIGLSMTNTSPVMTPTRGKGRILGTNPLACFASAGSDSFELDMATTAVAVGKIEVAKTKGESIPEGWALDVQGHPTTDPVAGFAGSNMPLGGDELHSGYKGYGLSVMVELFCGVLGGASFGPNVRQWMSLEREANLGQCFIALNPDCFAEGYQERLTSLLSSLRETPAVDPSLPILVAGDPEKQHMEKVDRLGGIAYHENQINLCNKLAERLKVDCVEVLQNSQVAP
ncbi:unnamed protein product [Cyprideis torosa]|uniref:Uncharacterized protein n=1 Tax=Cyprideis torosa TaxID=163714 RepID=A0A7R8WT30_9CRUS|nr:unnamed protein product [Cyprideis torosa]CAG0905333.1 unnamed protein product [Cyprideis torosa]